MKNQLKEMDFLFRSWLKGELGFFFFLVSARKLLLCTFTVPHPPDDPGVENRSEKLT